MKGQPNDRAIMLGQYIIENKSTVRAAAKKFGISKSTVHKDVSERLPKIQPQLYPEVKKCWSRTRRNVISGADLQQRKNMRSLR